MGQEREHVKVRSGSRKMQAGAAQEQGRSILLFFLPISAPMQYFMGRIKVKSGQERGRNRAEAGQGQEPNYSLNTKFNPNWG